MASCTAGRCHGPFNLSATASTIPKSSPLTCATSSTAVPNSWSTGGSSVSGHSHASSSPRKPKLSRRREALTSNRSNNRRAISASSRVHSSPLQNPYFRNVLDDFAFNLSSKRSRERNSSFHLASSKAACDGSGRSNIKCQGCRTRVIATKPTPGCAATPSLRRTRTRLSVIPCAFQCVTAHAKVNGNCCRTTFLSDAASDSARKIGTHLRPSTPSSGKKLRGSFTGLPDSSTPTTSSGMFNSSNSTITQIGARFRESADAGSPPSGQMKPLTTPNAPFTRPTSTHSFLVNSTRAPTHN